ncbi:hypothetical protein [Nocardia sp. CA-119907]|uniref:hypothetical protein n=1 Tax=Nocardia sp. CA-119907 TaxID=3239973 RepID=UPI003D959CDF
MGIPNLGDQAQMCSDMTDDRELHEIDEIGTVTTLSATRPGGGDRASSTQPADPTLILLDTQPSRSL